MLLLLFGYISEGDEETEGIGTYQTGHGGRQARRTGRKPGGYIKRRQVEIEENECWTKRKYLKKTYCNRVKVKTVLDKGQEGAGRDRRR